MNYTEIAGQIATAKKTQTELICDVLDSLNDSRYETNKRLLVLEEAVRDIKSHMEQLKGKLNP